MSNHVFVIDTNKQPRDPVHPAQARLLLNQKKAAVFRRFPLILPDGHCSMRYSHPTPILNRSLP